MNKPASHFRRLLSYIQDIFYNHFILINNNACTVYGMGLTKEYVINCIDGSSPLLALLFEIMSAEDAKAFVEAHWDSI